MKLSYEPGGLVVRLSGNLAINGATQLWEDISTRAGEGTNSFIFDFSDVHIITSAGIGTLVRLFVRPASPSSAAATRSARSSKSSCSKTSSRSAIAQRRRERD